jgi:hypothetical protein
MTKQLHNTGNHLVNIRKVDKEQTVTYAYRKTLIRTVHCRFVAATGLSAASVSANEAPS